MHVTLNWHLTIFTLTTRNAENVFGYENYNKKLFLHENLFRFFKSIPYSPVILAAEVTKQLTTVLVVKATGSEC